MRDADAESRRGGCGPGDEDAPPAKPWRAGNAFGLTEAAVGIVVGFLLGDLAASAYLVVSHSHATDSLGAVLCSLSGLWVGLLGAAFVASRNPRGLRAATGGPGWVGPATPSGHLAQDYGFRLCPWPDIPVGLAVGLVGQYGLVRLFELPLEPFVHNLWQRVGQPAQQLTAPEQGAGLVVLGLFVCLGSPVVEELFFRGLLMRALLGKTARLGRVLQPVISIGATSLLFALAHFEAIQFLGLAGFGALLGILAWWTGRLGPGIVAHATFNAVAFISLARSH